MQIKKLLALFLALAMTVGLAGCGVETDNGERPSETPSGAVISETEGGVISDSGVEETVAVTSKAEQPSETVTDAELIYQIWQEYLDKNLQAAEKFLVTDINNDGKHEVIFVGEFYTKFAYYNNGKIKELGSFQWWGDGCISGGMPLYYNEFDDRIMTMDNHSGYVKYSFYDFIDGDYQLSHELIWEELKVAWTEDKLAEVLPDLLDNMSMEDLIKEALGLGYYDRVNQFTVDNIEISEEQWEGIISEFKNMSGSIMLCPCNFDLSFFDLKNMGDNFTVYIEEKLFS